MMGWNVPNSPDAYVRLIKAVDRSAFAVHMDLCNGVNSPERFYDNGAFISECFRKLGRWIMSCHAKDLEWKPELNVHFVEVVPGRGSVDYAAYLRELRSCHIAAADAGAFEDGRGVHGRGEYIRKIGKQAGVSFA